MPRRKRISPRKDSFLTGFYTRDAYLDYYWTNLYNFYRDRSEEKILTIYVKEKRPNTKRWRWWKTVFLNFNSLLEHLHFEGKINKTEFLDHPWRDKDDWVNELNKLTSRQKVKLLANEMDWVINFVESLRWNKAKSIANNLKRLRWKYKHKLEERAKSRAAFLHYCLWKAQQNWKKLWRTVDMELVRLRKEKYSTTTTYTTSTVGVAKKKIMTMQENTSEEI